jgi:hypothetical protein
MAKKSILQSDKSYNFSDYFEFNYPTEEIVAEFGYQYELTRLTLPKAEFTGSLTRLKDNFYRWLPHVSLTSETAKREVLIAPVLLELLDYVDLRIDIEYPVYVSEQLKGNFDYLLHATHEFLVVEAKKADLEKGFTQLAVELIALDRSIEDTCDRLFGVITIGDLWRFGMLDRAQKRIFKDIDSFRVPPDLEELFRVLIGILKAES